MPRLGKFFFCVSRYAPALNFANQPKKKNKKKLSSLSDFLRGIPTQSLRVRTGNVGRPLHSIQNPQVDGFSSDLGKRVALSLAKFSAHEDLQGGATFRIKRGGKRDCQWMTARLLIVVIGEGSRPGLTRRRTLFFSDGQL